MNTPACGIKHGLINSYVMIEGINISIIVPVWRGAVKFLPKLLDSVPANDDIEIIVVDNSKEPIARSDINSQRSFSLLYVTPERHAGGSRNEGIKAAQGKWIIFADADDYFTPDAFDIFYSHIDSDSDIIFTKPEGIYEDTGERSDRADQYIKLVHGFCTGEVSEEDLRLGFGTPWCKMIRRDLVVREKLRFDEIRASNDIYFSLTSGYYANKIEADDRTTYIVTVNRGSLTQHRDYEVIRARLEGKLHCNKFLKAHNLGYRQRSVMFALAEARNFGFSAFLRMAWMIIRAGQNPFVGWRNWMKTARVTEIKDKVDNKYIVR